MQELRKQTFVIPQTVMLHRVDYVEMNKIPDDTWDQASWDESMPKGKNWNIEAIKAISAWDYQPFMEERNIAIIDGMFYDRHEDIDFAVVRDLNEDFNWGGDFLNYTERSHGTHVAGTALAIHNNQKGISGVFPKGKAVAVGILGKNNGAYWIDIKASIALALIKDASVINASLGWMEWYIKEVENNYEKTLQEWSDYLNPFFDGLEQLKYDFVFVNSAGNESMDAKYHYWTNFVTNPFFKDRLIVVGSIGQNADKSYKYSAFSNYGSAVDIVAPGEKIYSCVMGSRYEDWNILNGDWSGTSMAAPHVTGVAAMIWSINPKLTGAEVKKILLRHGTEISDGHGYMHPLLDAYACVKESYDRVPGTLSGTVVDSTSQEFIQGAHIAIIPEKDTEAIVVMECDDGTFKMNLKKGAYRLEITKAGYIPYSKDIIIKPNKTLEVATKLAKTPTVKKGRLEGKITCEYEDVIEAQVTIQQGITVISSLRTDENGDGFTFTLDDEICHGARLEVMAKDAKGNYYYGDLVLTPTPWQKDKRMDNLADE